MMQKHVDPTQLNETTLHASLGHCLCKAASGCGKEYAVRGALAHARCIQQHDCCNRSQPK